MANKKLSKYEAKFLKPMFGQPKGVWFKYGVIIDTHQGNIDLVAWSAKMSDEKNNNTLLDSVFVSRMWSAARFP